MRKRLAQWRFAVSLWLAQQIDDHHSAGRNDDRPAPRAVVGVSVLVLVGFLVAMVWAMVT